MEFTDKEIKYVGLFETECDNLTCEFLKRDIGENFAIAHYTSLDGLFGILNSATLHFTEYTFLNDSSEGEYIFEVFKEVLSEYGDKYESDFIEIITQELEIKPFNDIYDKDCIYNFVSCFSTDSDCLSLWKYYTKNNDMQGFNLLLNKRLLEKSLGQYCGCSFFYEFYVVMYELKRQKEFLLKLLDCAQKIWRDYHLDKICRFVLNHLYSIRFAFKHPAFSAEKEMRLIKKMEKQKFNKELLTKKHDSPENLVKLQIKNNFLVPYLEVPIPKESIIEITASPLVSDKLRESIRFLLRKNGYDLKIPITPSKIPLRY